MGRGGERKGIVDLAKTCQAGLFLMHMQVSRLMGSIVGVWKGSQESRTYRGNPELGMGGARVPALD